MSADLQDEIDETTSAGAELVREGEIDFAKPLARALLRDGRLSWGARGLFAFLWDLPDGWRPRISHLVLMGPDGREAVRSRLAELEGVGALRIEALRGEKGLLAGKRWVLVSANRWAIATPLKIRTENRETRSSVKPRIGVPDAKVHQGDEGSSIPTRDKENEVNDAGLFFLPPEIMRHEEVIMLVARTANLDWSQVQKLIDALMGASRLAEGHPWRPRQVGKWLVATARAISANEFVEGETYLGGRGHRLAVQHIQKIQATSLPIPLAAVDAVIAARGAETFGIRHGRFSGPAVID